MAKSIYEIADSGIAEVEHMGETKKSTCNICMPAWWTKAANLAFNLDDREMWDEILTMKTDDIRALLQASAAKKLIEIRAVARPPKKSIKEGEGARELLVPYKGKMPQDRVDEFELKPMKRPGAGANVKDNTIEILAATIQAMQEMGMEDEVIITMMRKKFSAEQIDEAINTIA